MKPRAAPMVSRCDVSMRQCISCIADEMRHQIYGLELMDICVGISRKTNNDVIDALARHRCRRCVQLGDVGDVECVRNSVRHIDEDTSEDVLRNVRDGMSGPIDRVTGLHRWFVAQDCWRRRRELWEFALECETWLIDSSCHRLLHHQAHPSPGTTGAPGVRVARRAAPRRRRAREHAKALAEQPAREQPAKRRVARMVCDGDGDGARVGC